jgi:hypothetical protein
MAPAQMRLSTSLVEGPSVAIILVNWNNWQDCIECIDSVLAQQYSRFHIYLVDNDSQDRSLEQLQAWFAAPTSNPCWRYHDGVDRWTTHVTARPIPFRTIGASDKPAERLFDSCAVTLIRSEVNSGFAGGCNLGIRIAALEKFDYFWLLNTDTVVCRDALGALVARAQEDGGIGMVGSTVRYYDRPSIIQAMGGAHLQPEKAASRHIGQGCGIEDIPRLLKSVEHEMSFVFGASMLVSKRLICEVGLMTEDYFLYYEEIDWAMRSRTLFRLGYAANSHVFHKSGNSSAKVLPAFAASYYYRNRLRFTSRFFPQFLGAAKRRLFVELLRTTIKGNWSRAVLLAKILYKAEEIAAQAIRSVNRPRFP